MGRHCDQGKTWGHGDREADRGSRSQGTRPVKKKRGDLNFLNKHNHTRNQKWQTKRLKVQYFKKNPYVTQINLCERKEFA